MGSAGKPIQTVVAGVVIGRQRRGYRNAAATPAVGDEEDRKRFAMRVTAGKSTTMLIMLGALIGPFACAPRVAPPPPTVRRVAVLPPCDATGGPLGGRSPSVTTYGAPVESLGDILASAARDEIARRGCEDIA